MTKHERLTYLLKAAAKALHLPEEIEEDQGGTGVWNDKEVPALRWHGLIFTPVDIIGQVYHGVQTKEVRVPGWALEYEIYYHGTQWEAPAIEVEEVTREVHEWAVVKAAVLHVIQDRLAYVLGEAEEALLINNEVHAEEEHPA